MHLTERPPSIVRHDNSHRWTFPVAASNHRKGRGLFIGSARFAPISVIGVRQELSESGRSEKGSKGRSGPGFVWVNSRSGLCNGLQRSGQPLPAAAKLLFSGSQLAPYELRRLTVLHVPTAEMADGLQQWPGTRALIAVRLGPTALAVAEEHVDMLRERLATLGVSLRS